MVIIWLWFVFLGCFSIPANAQLGRYINCLFPADWEGREVKLIIKPLDQFPIIDTATIIDHRVIFNARLVEPTAAYIWVAGNKDDIDFLIDSPQITITVDPPPTGQVIVVGSPSGDLWRQQHRVLSRLSESLADMRSVFWEEHDRKDSLATLKFGQLSDSLERVYNQRIVSMIEENPAAISSWHLFASYYISLPYAAAARLFDKLSSFGAYPSYKEVAENIYQKRLGIKAPDFTLADIFGDSITLSKQESKFILVDFSSTAMLSCKARHYTLRKIYEAYHPFGLEIITLSPEFNAPEAKQALLHEHLPWPVLVLDMNALAPTVVNDYKIVKMPDNVLLDSRKTIVGRDLSPADLTGRLKELMNVK